MGQPCHSIKVAAKLTGLTTHVIRVWEKRYAAVVPSRTDSKRRLFSDDDLQRLNLLRQATELGHSIGTIARLDDNSLRDLLQRTEAAAANRNGRHGVTEVGGEKLDGLLEAIRRFDNQAMVETLGRLSLSLGTQGLLLKVIAPLAQAIGDQWEKGELNAAHEHFASSAIREFLQTSKPYALSVNSPVLVVATPSGQLHELGAVIVAHAAINQGWKVIYLGTSLPAAEIAGAALQQHARAVALSVVYPSDDPSVAEEIVSLRRYLAPEVFILVGGRAANCYRPALRRVNALIINDLPELFLKLDELRQGVEPFRR